jgi:hypothetical protein
MSRRGGQRPPGPLELVSQSSEEALADERAGQVHEGLVQFGAALPADAQAAELVQLSEGSLDDPAHPPEARAVLGGAAGDDRLDAAGPQLTAYLSWSTRSAIRLSARWRGRPGLPRIGPTPSTSGSSWVTSFRLPPVSVAASGIPEGSTIR